MATPSEMMHTIPKSVFDAVLTLKRTETPSTTTGVTALIIWMKETDKRYMEEYLGIGPNPWAQVCLTRYTQLDRTSELSYGIREIRNMLAKGKNCCTC